MNNLKTLLWWMYEPNDERERQLYFLAYQRCNKIFFAYILLICTTYLLGQLGVDMYTYPLGIYIAFAVVTLMTALVSGSIVFRHQEISFKDRKNYYWQIVRNEFYFIIFALLFNSVLFSHVFGVFDYVEQIPGVPTVMETIFGVLSIATLATAVIGGLVVIIRKLLKKK